jgi:hypothetical protein
VHRDIYHAGRQVVDVMVASRIDRFTVLWLSWLVCLALVAGKPSDDDVAGPVVKIKQLEVPGPPASPPVADNNTSHTIAQIIDQALQKEFKDDTDKAENDVGKSFNETAKKNEVGCWACYFVAPMLALFLNTVVQHVRNTQKQHGCT